MYIPEFWCGVLATVGAEVAVIIISVIISTNRKRFQKGMDTPENKDGD